MYCRLPSPILCRVSQPVRFVRCGYSSKFPPNSRRSMLWNGVSAVQMVSVRLLHTSRSRTTQRSFSLMASFHWAASGIAIACTVVYLLHCCPRPHDCDNFFGSTQQLHTQYLMNRDFNVLQSSVFGQRFQDQEPCLHDSLRHMVIQGGRTLRRRDRLLCRTPKYVTVLGL